MTTTVDRPANGSMRGAKVLAEPVYTLLPDFEDDLDAMRAEAPAEVAKGPSRLATVRATMAADLRRWWLVTAEPPSLADWWALRNPLRVPDDTRLRVSWYVDHTLTGLPLVALSTALFLAASGVRWVACHPARRWAFAALTAAIVGLWLA